MSKADDAVRADEAQISTKGGSVDAAWTFLNDHQDANIETSSVDIRAI